MNSIGNILAKNRKKLKYTQPMVAELMEKAGYKISYKSLSVWEKNKAQPSLEEFFMLCRILEIKDIYEEVFGDNPYSLLKGLSEEGRAKAEDYVDLLKSSGKYNRKAADIIPIRKEIIRLYKTPVSAGTGNFLDSDYYEDMERTDRIPTDADFGVIISGDSMMPTYKDGQTIWVQKTDLLSDGDIGVFLLDGNAYVKRLRNSDEGTFLVSLNKRYNPMPVTEYSSLYVFGRVLN